MRIVYISLLPILFAVCLTDIVHAQFGVSFQQQNWSAADWEDRVAENDSANLAQKQIRIGAHYWFRLKDQRIEFLPEVAWSFPIAKRISGLEGQLHALSAQVNVDIYPFDLNNDCNCPTFSKQGGAIEKSLFLEIAPGIQWNRLQVVERSDDQATETRHESKHLAFRLAAGAGFDLGISDLLTISPWIQGVWLPSATWDGLGEALHLEGESDVQSDVFTLGYGVRLLFRPDYNKRRF